ncbi:MAG: Npt1/Npt2 family nucleotide transporter [Bacteroidota bacterium]
MKFLNRFILRSFDIRKGEFVPAILLQLNIFLIILTFITLKPTVNSLFLSKFSVQQLPYAFILLAVFAGIVSLFYSKILSKISLSKMMMYTNGSGILFLIGFGILLQLRIAEEIVLYLLYIWLSVFVALASSQFWILTNIVFSVREAKRLFGFIGAGAIAGGIMGGYLASILANIISSKNIMFIAAIFLVFCLPITNSLWRNHVLPKLTHFQQKKRIPGIASNPIAIIKKSRYLSLIAGIVGLGVVVSKLVDYQFSAIVTSKINNPDDLTAFFGFWFSTFNVISLVIQLFLTRRVVGVYGVGVSLLILPVGISIATLLLLFLPVLWVVIFLQLNDASLKNSLNRTAIELLSLPIPMEIKSRVKTFIDVFVDKGATGIAGILLIFVINGLQLPAMYINLAILLLIAFWIHLAYQIRLEYLKSLQAKLLDLNENQDKRHFDISNKSVFEGIIKILELGTEKQVLYMLKKVQEFKDKRLFPSIKKLLIHSSGKIRAAALQNLYLYKHPVIVDDVKLMIEDTDPDVKIQAMEYLIAHSPENRIALINEYIENEDHRINGAALLSLAIQSRNNPEMRKIFKTVSRIQEKIDYLKVIDDTGLKESYKANILCAMGHANIPQFYPFVQQKLDDKNIEVAKEAIMAAGNTLSPFFIDHLLNCLMNNDLRDVAAVALANYGKEIIHSLSGIVNNPETNVELVRKLPLIIEKIGSQPSVDFLFKLLQFEDVAVRLEALRSLNELKIKFPYIEVNKKPVVKLIIEEANLYLDTLGVLYAQSNIDPNAFTISNENLQNDRILDARKSLIELLERRLDGILERIFRLLGLTYPPQEIFPIYDGIRNKNPDFRVNAVEFLDNLLEINLKRILMPIIETALMEEISREAIENLGINLPDDHQCFTMLMEGKDVKIKMAVLYLIAQLGDKKFLPLVQQYITSDNQKIKDFALRTSDALTCF